MVFYVPSRVYVVEKLPHLHDVPRMWDSVSKSKNINAVDAKAVANVFVRFSHSCAHTLAVQKHSNYCADVLSGKFLIGLQIVNNSLRDEGLKEKQLLNN